VPTDQVFYRELFAAFPPLPVSAFRGISGCYSKVFSPLLPSLVVHRKCCNTCPVLKIKLFITHNKKNIFDL
jgi:hypothetical protein